MRKWGSPCRPRRTLRLITSPTWHPVSSYARASKSLLGLVFVGGGRGFAGGVVVVAAVVFVFRRVAWVFFAGVVAVAIVRAVIWTVAGERICGKDIFTCKQSSMYSGNMADESCFRVGSS